MLVPNYYDILDVPFDASHDAIRQSFRALARRYHPDTTDRWEIYFVMVTEAYRTLRDPRRRAAYNEILRHQYPHFFAGPAKRHSSRRSLPAPPQTALHQTVVTKPLPEFAPAVSSSTVISPSMTIMGHLTSGRDVIVHGAVHGTLRLPASRLVVGPTGRVSISVVASEIEVEGSMIGEIRGTNRVILRSGARVTGDIHTPGLVIEDGACVTGRIEMWHEVED